LTITRLGPGCECQPKDPPGTMMFCNIQTSDSPFVLMRACQLLEDSAKLFGRWFGLSPFAGGGAERILAGAGRVAPGATS